MTNAEAIKALKDIWFEYIDHLSVESMKHIEYKPAIDMAVEALEKSEISNEKSNESQMDLINRRDAVNAIRAMQTYKLFAGDDMRLVNQAEAMTELMMLPSAQPDLSGYSDRLWKAAYERGKAEADIIHCLDCKYYHSSYCEVWSKFGTIQTRENGFCYMAERKEGEADEADY